MSEPAKVARKSPTPKGVRLGGRAKGVPNKATANARAAIAAFIDGNSGRLQEWLDQIAETEGPKAAFNCFVDLIEYHVPKLARHEVAGDPERPVVVAGLNAQEFEELAAKAAREV